MIAKHLLQRVFGTMIEAARSPLEARVIVDRAESTLGWDDACAFCQIMLSVPATIACARAGDLPHALRHLEVAERSAVVAGDVMGGGHGRGMRRSCCGER